MEAAENDFGRALSIDAESIGRPGQRRFRLLVRSTSRSAGVWMEKEQLAGIGSWFEETLERLDRERPTSEPDVEPLPTGDPELEIRAGQIALGYVEEEDLFAFHAFDIERSGTVPSFRVLATRGQCRVLARKIVAVVAGGRPICPLCDRPMDPEGHVCPRSNGHHAAVRV
jgi:uncharacterized repeat protein (TIGR03847 family)